MDAEAGGIKVQNEAAQVCEGYSLQGRAAPTPFLEFPVNIAFRFVELFRNRLYFLRIRSPIR